MTAHCFSAEATTKDQLCSLIEAAAGAYRFQEVKDISMAFAGMKWHAIVIFQPTGEVT